MTNDPYLSRLLDEIMADCLAFRAFMLEIAVQIGRQRQDSDAWAVAFIQSIHERIDNNEASMGDKAMKLPVHELARSRIDRLGKDLRSILELPPPSTTAD